MRRPFVVCRAFPFRVAFCMDSASDNLSASPIGKSVHAEGVITLRRQDASLARLRPGMEVYEGEEITTTGMAHATIEFIDHGRIAIDPTTALRFERFCYERDPEDICQITLFYGAIAMTNGRIAEEPDAVIVEAGPMTLNVHAASLICRLSPNGIKADVTLLSPSSHTCGEILVHNNVAVETLNMSNHTLRIDGKHGYVTKPMTVTSNVLREIYKGAAVGAMLHNIWSIAREDDEIELELLADSDPKGFEMFRNLNDRLLERRFLTQHIYPGGHTEEDEHNNDLLEDAFEGERFRLKQGSDQN